MNLNEVIEQEQLEKDRGKLMKQKTIDDIRWDFITDIIMQSKDKKISDHDMTLVYKYTEFLKKELGL